MSLFLLGFHRREERQDGGRIRPGWEPYVAIFSGNPEVSPNDWTHVDAAGVSREWRLSPTNNRSSLWFTATDRLWEPSLYGITLPYAGSTQISESLIG